jgi:hypothetical protein
MKKIIIPAILLLISVNLQAQQVETYRYAEQKAITAVPATAKGVIKENGKREMPPHKVPEFKGKVPPGAVKNTLRYEAPGLAAITENTENSPNSPASCLNYQGLNDNETTTGLTPPDVNGSVGINNVMVTLNNGVKIQALNNGASQLVNTLGGFFAPLSPVFAFDPKTLYDQYNDRWIVTCPDATNAAQSRLLLAVSQTGNPLGTWNFYAIDVDPANATWFDYPSIGINRNWIVITGNMFGGAFNVSVFAINKQAAYTGTLNVTRFVLNGFGSTVHPAITYDNNLNTEWLCNDWNGNSGGNGLLRLYNITGTPAAPVLNTPATFPSVATTWSSADQNVSVFGCTSVRAIDGRMRSLVYQAGSLWAVQKIGLPTAAPTRASTQWWEINPATGAAVQFGRIDDATGANMYFNPSLSVNANRDVLIGYSHFSNTANPRASYSFRSGTDAVNTLQPVLDYRTSAGMVCTGRWGDYSSTVTDPNGTNLWTLQQYVPAGAGTWWSMVCPPVSCPASYNITTPVSAANTKFETSGTITASSLVNPPNGFVKYDAARSVQLNPGFNTAITSGYFTAYIDGCGGLRIGSDNLITRTEEVIPAADNKKVSEPGGNSFMVYPNPSSDLLFIQMPKSATIVSAELRDAQGRLMPVSLKNDANPFINISRLAPGNYFLKVNTKQGAFKTMFIKQ